MHYGSIAVSIAFLAMAGCSIPTADGHAAAATQIAKPPVAPQKAAMVAALSRVLQTSEKMASSIVADEPFRIWPRQLAGDLPFSWGVRANELQMIDSPVGGGLAQRIELRTAGRFTVRMQPPPGKRLFFLCGVEPSTFGDPNQPGLVQWEAKFDGSMPAARGSFSRDPQTNYWAFATSNVTTGALGYVEITSPLGPEMIWAIGLCDVLTFELAPPN